MPDQILRIQSGLGGWGKGSQWSLKYNDDELKEYMKALEVELPLLASEVLVELAQEGIAFQQRELAGMASLSKPAKFNHEGRWHQWGRSTRKVEDVIAKALRHRFSMEGGEGRISVYSDPYPTGAEGSRGGKVARYYEDGRSDFFTGVNRQGGGGFMHKGFPALQTMQKIGVYISEGFIDRFLKKAHKVAPGGSGSGHIASGGSGGPR